MADRRYALIGHTHEASTYALNDLTDVVLTVPTTGDLLRYDGANWVNYPDSNFAAASHTHLMADITDSTWLSNVVEDTTPQLGGNLDAQTFNITSLTSLEIEDSLGTTTVTFDFNSTVFELTGAGPAAPHIDIENISSVDHRSGCYSVWRSSDNLEAFTLQAAGAGNINATLSTATDFRFIAANVIDIRDGATLRIRDAGDTDYLDIAHDGTDVNITANATADMNFVGATYYNFDDDINVTVGGVQATGTVSNTGVNDQLVFLDVASGYGRVGSYNWSLGTYQPMLVEGNTVRLNTRGGDLEIYNAGTSLALIDTSLTRFDLFNLDFRIRDGKALTIWDSTDTDNASFSHDGTDFNTAFTTTTDWNVTGLTNFNLLEGMQLRVSGPTNAGQIVYAHNDTDLNITNVSTTDWNIIGLTGGVWIRDGAFLKISDSTDLDHITVSHNGTNVVNTFAGTTNYHLSTGGVGVQIRDGGSFYIYDSADTYVVRQYASANDITFEFTGVTDWNITGLTTGAVWLRDGAKFRISDSTDADYAEFSHDGTDFNTTFVTTTDWNIEDLSNLVLRDGADFLIYGPTNAAYGQLYNDDTSTYLNASGGQLRFHVAGALKMGIASTYNYDYQPRLQLEAAAAVADVASYGQWWVKSDTPNRPYFTDDTGVDYPLGYNAMPVKEQDAAYTFAATDAGYILHKDAGAALSFTCDNVSTIPQGTTWVVFNDDTEDLTIAQGTGVTVYWLEGGSAKASGNVTVSQGGIVTVYKYSDTVYYVWGSKAAGGGISSVVEDTTPQLGGDLDGQGNNLDNIGVIFMSEQASADADVAGDGQWWVKDNAPNDAYFTCDTGIDYPLGYATYRRSASTTLDHINQSLNMTTDSIADAMVNGCWVKNNTTAYTLTLEPSTDTQFPVGGQISLYNRGSSGNMTVTEGTGTTLYVLDGSTSTDAAGSATVGPGGYATIIRESTTVYVMMGAGVTP